MVLKLLDSGKVILVSGLPFLSNASGFGVIVLCSAELWVVWWRVWELSRSLFIIGLNIRCGLWKGSQRRCQRERSLEQRLGRLYIRTRGGGGGFARAATKDPMA